MSGLSNTSDRRSYSRLGLGISACAFCDGLNKEVKCMVQNISEKGLCLEIEVFEGYQKFFTRGTPIMIQFVDSFPFGSDIESDVEIIKCSIRHVKEEEGKIIIGCFVSSEEYGKYVQHRALSRYMQKTYKA